MPAQLRVSGPGFTADRIYDNVRFRPGEGSDQSVEAWHIARAMGRYRYEDYVLDSRRDYGEIRYRGYGYIDGLVYCLVFTDRNGRVRPISLRRAHNKEMRRHVP